jgi:4a-hydroxytetrahydrobiopterin dehydratase
MISRALLDEAAIEAGLRTTQWRRDGAFLVRAIRFTSFTDAVEFVAAIAPVAESINHHPDIDVRWRTVNLRVQTHSEGGLTEFDFELARRLDALAAERGGSTAMNVTP